MLVLALIVSATPARAAPAQLFNGTWNFDALGRSNETIELTSGIIAGVSGAYLFVNTTVAIVDPHVLPGAIGIVVGVLDTLVGVFAMARWAPEAGIALVSVGSANVIVGLVTLGLAGWGFRADSSSAPPADWTAADD